jgi:sucrose-6-phosphate hydrolase SacC (GH32 family)
MSVPRELALRATTEGIRLVQRPVRELARLRGPAPSLRAPSLRAANDWLASRRIAAGPLQLRVGFGPRDTGRQGVALFVSSGTETTVGIDRDRGTVYVDRTRSGKTDFHADFAGVFSAPLPRAKDKVWLELVVDESSVEVFANDGERVLTSLVLPPDSSRGIALFGPDDSRIVSLEAWPLGTGRGR